ncbi:transmembrane protein 177 [Clupea harengus]|uniref:Transmembrane protein 177 n=1 Tax=Clupea harengus TaxID=7950 RepID=A0A6P3VMC3_CLUHA|nr:transmembrane protein 177 [Clupea harengus]XP_031436611.1 transmembrane protein 177 [Clupea harengus]
MSSSFLKLSAFLQKYRTPVLLIGCGGAFTANIFYHVFPNGTYRKLYQAWSKGQPASLSEKLENTFQAVLKDCAVGSSENYSAFASFGFQPLGAGIPWLPAGAQVGIPANFNSTTDDAAGITNRTILINGKEVEWDSDIGTNLKQSLLFSPEAQKFAIAREVIRLETAGPLLHAAVAPACLAGICVNSVVLKHVFGLYAGPLLARGVVNLVVVGLGAAFYMLASDEVSQWLDYKSDRRAASLSLQYAKGGVEFYDKILSRNQSLRMLMGPKGEEVYAPSGNLFPTNLFSMKHAPYTARRDGIAGLLKELKM